METTTRTGADLSMSRNAISRSSIDNLESSESAVSWSAIVAGGVAAAALSLILLILGTGLGFSSVSPWAREGISASTLGITAIVWVTVTQILASGMGGYIAGRMRTQWTGVHTDEVYFRDTAHGFLAWAVASLATAALLTSVIGSILGAGTQAAATIAGGAVSAATGAAKSSANADVAATSATGIGSISYLVDTLFRKDMSASLTTATGSDSEQAKAATAAESAKIFVNAIQSGALTPDDTRYLGQAVAQRTGLSQADAEKRVTTTFARLQAKLQDAEVAAREAADKARKASAYSALWLFISLLIGAFCASLAATFGGRQRRA